MHMNRRHFLQQTSRAALAAPFVSFPPLAKKMRMGIIVHSYAHRWHSDVESKKYPGFADALDLMDHCAEIGAGGVQVMVGGWGEDFARRVRDRREKLGLYLEGSIALPKDRSDLERFEKEIIAAREAGAGIVRTVCLSGRRYENFQTLQAFETFREGAIASLHLAEPVVRKHSVRLAVENHKDWRAAELAGILGDLDSEWVGVNLDFGNNVALMEDPTDVARILQRWIMTTHVKDMGVEEYADGFLLSEVPLGDGYLELEKIFSLCREEDGAMHFNLEMITRDPLKVPCLTNAYWATYTDVAPSDLARTVRTVREHRFAEALPKVSHLAPEEKLAVEEANILRSLKFSKTDLGLG